MISHPVIPPPLRAFTSGTHYHPPQLNVVSQLETQPQGDQRCGSKVSQVSSGVAVAAAYWQSKVQAAQPHSKKLGHSLQLAGSPGPKHRLPTWWENSGCPILWDDYRHGRPPLQHNADTLKRRLFTHSTSLTMARCCSATQSNI